MAQVVPTSSTDSRTLLEGTDNQQFFSFIVNLSAVQSAKIPTPESKILEQDCTTLLELITRNYRDNIHIAASHGRKIAYLCVYLKEAKYQSTIPIHDLIDMPERLTEIFAHDGIESLLSRLRKFLAPFSVSVRRLQECEELRGCNFYQHLSQYPEVMVVSVSWEVS
jgi:hypothetical protein